MAHDESLPEGNPFMEPNPWGGEHMRRPPAPLRPPADVPPDALAGLLGNYKVPEPARRVRNGDVIRLAGRDMFAVHTPGHTLDHLCIHDPEGGFVFTGDHVLPHITPYISGVASGTNPLLDYFASLERTAALPDVKQALPAHGVVIDDRPARQGDHRASPRTLRAAAQGFGRDGQGADGARVVDVPVPSREARRHGRRRVLRASRVVAPGRPRRSHIEKTASSIRGDRMIVPERRASSKTRVAREVDAGLLPAAQ